MRILAPALGACTPARHWRDQALGGNLCTPRGTRDLVDKVTSPVAQTHPRRKPLPHTLPYGSYRYSAKQPPPPPPSLLDPGTLVPPPLF